MSRRRNRRAHAAQAALALDALLTEAPPEVRAALNRAAEERMPRHLLDQVNAAQHESDQVMRRYSRTFADTPPVRYVRPVDIPDEMRLLALSTMTALTAGTHRQACPCDLTSPQPLTAAAWRPLTVACLAHISAFRAHPGSIVDRTCDRCGKVTDATDPTIGGIHAMTVQIGALIFMWGECVTCRKEHP